MSEPETVIPPATSKPAVSSFAIRGEPEQVTKLFAALAKAKRAFGPVLKGKDNPFYGSKYADLADYIAATREGLADNGLCIIQPVGRTSVDFWEVRTLLIHEAGAYLETVALLPPAGDMQKNGSAQTYCKRYCFSGMLGEASAAEDDDGNEAVGKAGGQKSQPTPPQVKAKPAQQSAPVASVRDTKADPVPKAEPAKPPAKLDAATTPPQDEPAAKPATIPPPAAETAPLAPGANPYPPTEATKLKIKALLDELGMKASTVDWCMKLLGVPPKGITSEAQQLVLLADLEGRKAAPGDA